MSVLFDANGKVLTIETVVNQLLSPDWEKNEIKIWLQKMYARAMESDIEANFRRHWLLHDSLECYFKIRDSWYLGPKEGFEWLKVNDQETFRAFEAALHPDASSESIGILIKYIQGSE